LAEIWEKYKESWSNPQVVDFAKKVIAQPALVSEANKWQELYR